MVSLKQITALVLLFCVGSASFAETEAERMTKLSEETGMLNAEKAVLDAQTKVAESRAALNKARQSDGDLDLPTLRSIEGIDGRLRATVVTSHGVSEDVRKDEKTHDGWTVIAIDGKSVTLARGKEQLHLPISGESATSGSGSGAMPLSPRTNSSSIQIPYR